MSLHARALPASTLWRSIVPNPAPRPSLLRLAALPPLGHARFGLFKPVSSSAKETSSLRHTSSFGLRHGVLQVQAFERPRAREYESLTRLVKPTFRRSIHHSTRSKQALSSAKSKRSASHDAKKSPTPSDTQPGPSAKSSSPSTASTTTGNSKPLLERLPNITQRLHRPTKEELLAAATGFWSRFKVHFKWFSIKSTRPFNSDDISAFFSWIIVGHVVWILVGTTTFFSLAILMVNTVFAQETLARWIGNYLTQSSGVNVIFESAIVPKWKDGVISFKNVFVSRRPGQGSAHVSKGSQTTAASAAAAAAAAATEQSHAMSNDEEDTNYTKFDLSIDTVNVTLSFAKWFNGKGLLRDVEIEGIRGIVDRRTVERTPEGVDPRSYRHQHSTGDFELESFKMQDVLITVYQPGDFRPFAVSIYTCDLPQLRKQWLFYDFLSANNISGSYDNSLFTIHPHQGRNYTGAHANENLDTDGPAHWKKHSRIRIDGLNIDHLNRGVEGPFSWIHEGNVDINANVMIPADDDESLAKVMSDFYDRVEATVTSTANNHTINNHPDRNEPPLERTSKAQVKPLNEDDRFLVMDLRVHLNDIRAAVPIFTRDISYVNNAFIRPIVAYMNSRHTFIPVTCRVVKGAEEFDGSWTLFDSGLMDDLSREMYEAFARDVVDDQARRRRFLKVGMWTIQLAAQALFIGLAGNYA